MIVKQTTYNENFSYNYDATNVATIADCENFIQSLLNCKGTYGIEIVEQNGKTYTKLYNSGDSLIKVFSNNLNKKLRITAYSLFQKDEPKLKKMINKIFNIRTDEKIYHSTFEIWIIDQKTKDFINSKSRIKRNSKVSDELKTAIIVETKNFIKKYKSSSRNLLMYKGKYVYYHNHVTKAIDEIQSNIDSNLLKDVNEKTLRGYIGEELRQSKHILHHVIFHDIATGKTKGSSKWIAIVK